MSWLRALVVLSLSLPVPAAAATVREHALRVQLDPAAHSLSAVDTLLLAAPAGAIEFSLHEALAPAAGEAALSLSELPPDTSRGQGLRRWRLARADGATASARWLIRWEGMLYQDVSGTVFGREKVGAEIRATVGEEGVYLAASAGWYPLVGDSACAHRVTVVLPAGWSSLTHGRRLRDFTAAGRHETCWHAPEPSEGLDLVANRFRVDALQHGATLVETYFFPEDSSLAAGYLEACADYLDLYEGFLGPYPFAKFAVVENFFPTGYGMPSWTLLGQQVLRLPFIKATSLGHEIAHNWWGNSVFVGEGGNWCEGLTVYTADYLYKERESAEAARQYRRSTLKDYTHYTRDGSDFPLVEFVSRHDAATRAVGYGKSMFVFHMLEERVGREAFRAALRWVILERMWAAATWSDFFRAVERVGALAPGALADEQRQWLERPGAAQLALGDVTVAADGAGWILRGELVQEGEPLILSVPLRVETAAGAEDFTVQTAVARLPFERRLAAAPTSLAVDPDCHVFRRLYDEEMEATLSLILADSDPLFLIESDLAPELAAACREFAAAFVEGEPRVLESGAADAALDQARTVVWLGSSPPPAAIGEPATGLTRTPFFTMFQGQRFEPGRHALVYAGKRGAAGGYLAVLADAPGELRAIASKVPHYGKYSYLGFVSGQNQLKGNWEPAAGPLLRPLATAR